ncbi:hypothetical protein FRX31_028741 [Thalictrum thalictroides]|uniref:FHA domain-containing protein n=1 Tax=Thalictrum thalictroides TaxID=46969 RepID=A0A7J6VAM6_THATH|nr:hypothetical protein FRX31_028741 [Thalictrum thalictroides]
MGIVMEGFSIREYTSKIRTTNVEKCWPFDGNPKELKKEVVEELLPPITIKKFKWWSNDELEEQMVLEKKDSGFDKQVVVLRNEEKEVVEERVVMNCPVCLSYKASSVNAMGVHVDSCLARVSRKERKKAKMGGKAIKVGKSKQPIKKRSIMEIFAVAPQIEGIVCEEHDSKDEDDDDENKSKDEEEVVGILKKLKNASMKKKKKMKAIAKKEKAHKLKGFIQVGLVGKLKSSMISRKNSSSKTKSSAKPNKLKTYWAATVSRKYREPIGNLVHGILKKRKSVDSSGTSSAIGNTPGDDLTNHLHQANKHVRFSGRDYILGSPSSISHFLMQNSCEEHSSDLMVLPSASHHLEKGDSVSPATSKAADVNGRSKDVVTGVARGAGLQSVNANEDVDDIDCSIDLPTSRSMSCQDRGQALLDESGRRAWDYPSLENFHLLTSGKSSSLHNSSYATITGINSSSQTGLTNVPDKCAVSMQRFDVMDTMAGATSDSSTSFLNKSKEADWGDPFRRQDTLQHLESCASQHQPFFQLLPKDLVTSLSPSEHPKQDKASPFVYGNRFYDDNFIGLPVNSQGELINLRPRGKGGVNQLKKQNMKFSASNLPDQNFVGQKSSFDYLDYNRSCYLGTTVSKEKSKLFPVQDYVTNSNISSRIGISDLKGTRRTEILRKDLMERKNHSVHRLGFDLNQMSISSCGCSQYRQTQSQTEKETVKWVDNSDHSCLQTMRLMGKDVTVGRNSKEAQGCDDGKVWTDKNVIKEHCHTAVENSSLSRNFQLEATVNASSEKLKETRIQFLGSQGKPTRPSFLQNAIDDRLAHSYHNWQENKTPQSCMPLTPWDQSNMHHFCYPLYAEESMSRTLGVPGMFMYGPEYPKLCPEIHLPTSSQYPFHCMHLNSTQLQHNQSLFRSSPGFQSPFFSQGCGVCVQPSLSQRSSKGLPPWMLNASQEHGSPFSSPQIDATATNQAYRTTACNSSAVSSRYCTSESSQPNHYGYSLPRKPNPSRTSLVQRPLIPVPPGFKPNSSISTSYRNRVNLRNKYKQPLVFHHKNTDHVKRTTKRPADCSDASMKCSKKPIPEMPVQSDSMMEREKEVSVCRSSSYHTGEVTEPDAIRDSTRDADHLPVEINNGGMKALAVVNSSEVDSVGRSSGPIKLSAGGKHILKPGQIVHSSIRIGLVSNSDNVSELQKKSSKIYRF